MISADELRNTEAYLHAQIPLTRAMGMRVTPAEAGFAIEAPVALNSNHLQTAFGGSINSVATLAGYTYLWLALRDTSAHVVVRESTIRFLRPIRETIRAICLAPEPEALTAFRQALETNGRAPIKLHVRVEEHGSVAAEFVATFVARRE